MEETMEKLISVEALLSRAHKLKKECGEHDDLVLKKKFEVKFNDILLENRMISSASFLCAIYIAEILFKISYSVPTSWYAADYFIDGIENNKQLSLREGADVCFILYSLFPERCEHRSMTKRDYVRMGTGLYFRYYDKTSQEISYHMGTSFEPMSEITRECVKNL